MSIEKFIVNIDMSELFMNYVFTVSQEKTTDGINGDLDEMFILSDSQQHLSRNIENSCECRDNCETASASDGYHNITKKPKSGVLLKIIKKLISAKL